MKIVELCLIIFFSAGSLKTALSDLEYRHVPNGEIIFLALLAATRIAVFGRWENAYGLIFAVLLYLLCYKAGRGIGGADIKLAAVIGLYFGIYASLAVMGAACVSALVVELLFRAFGSRHKAGIPLCFYMGLTSLVLLFLQCAMYADIDKLV